MAKNFEDILTSMLERLDENPDQDVNAELSMVNAQSMVLFHYHDFRRLQQRERSRPRGNYLLEQAHRAQATPIGSR